MTGKRNNDTFSKEFIAATTAIIIDVESQIESDKEKQTAGEKAVAKLISWIRGQSPQSVKECTRGGALNKTKIATTAQIGKRSLNGQNPTAGQLFDSYEQLLTDHGYLAPVTKKQGGGSTRKADDIPQHDPNEQKLAEANNQIGILQQKVYELEVRLKRYEEFSDVLSGEGFFE